MKRGCLIVFWGMLVTLSGCSRAATFHGAALSRSAAVVYAPMVISHRGVPTEAEEHTFTGYDLAISQGSNWLELDINTTKDGYLLVCHDPIVPGGVGTDAWVAKLALEEIKDLQRPCQEPFYELEEVFVRYGGGVNYLLDLKELDTYDIGAQRLVGLIEQYQLSGKVIIESFSQQLLDQVYQQGPNLPLVLLFGRGSSFAAVEQALALSSHLSGVGLEYASVSPGLVHMLHQQGKGVLAYFAQEEKPFQVLRLRSYGVDGIITDYTERCKVLLMA